MTGTSNVSYIGVVSAWEWLFSSQDDAELFRAGYKEQMAEEGLFTYVDSQVTETEDGWKLVFQYVDHRGPEEAA